jgi:hypothetical protein
MKQVLGIFGIAAIAVLLLVGGTLGIHGGGKQLVIAKTDWPEKEGISHTLMGHGGMQDSCVSTHPFGLPTLRPAVC